MDKDDLKTKIVKLNKVDNNNDSSVDEREKLKAKYFFIFFAKKFGILKKVVSLQVLKDNKI
jgi:hypothetical protein